MNKTVLITGSTDGIGLVTAKLLASQGHTLLLHGRSLDKLERARESLSSIKTVGKIETYVADLSSLTETKSLAEQVLSDYSGLDVLINNAGVYKTPDSVTSSGIDIRIMVNTLAPYLLTKRLLKLMNKDSRVINVSSAAQAPVSLTALSGNVRLEDMAAYSQSKLALIMWTRELAKQLDNGPTLIAVNPGSLLASKMVKEGFGVQGSDLSIGAEIVSRLAISADFINSSGQYFDNDVGSFASPHPDALDDRKCQELVSAIEEVLTDRKAVKKFRGTEV